MGDKTCNRADTCHMRSPVEDATVEDENNTDREPIGWGPRMHPEYVMDEKPENDVFPVQTKQPEVPQYPISERERILKSHIENLAEENGRLKVENSTLVCELRDHRAWMKNIQAVVEQALEE